MSELEHRQPRDEPARHRQCSAVRKIRDARHGLCRRRGWVSAYSLDSEGEREMVLRSPSTPLPRCVLDIETATREKSKRPAHKAMESNRILFIMGA